MNKRAFSIKKYKDKYAVYHSLLLIYTGTYDECESYITEVTGVMREMTRDFFEHGYRV